MHKKLLLAITAVSLGLLGLAGCAQATSSAPGSGSSPGQSVAQDSSAGELATGQSTFGPVIVDGAGMTVYVYDKDTADSGQSTCEGDCLVVWPPVISASGVPKVTGVTGKVATITRSDGTKQVTVNGLPLYYYATDASAGDAKGQGIGGIWWILSPTGDKITAASSGY